MRHHQFDRLRPFCPHCLAEHGNFVPLNIGRVDRAQADQVIEGALHCTDPACFLEYPIVDGIPFLLPDPRRALNDNLFQLALRDDLGEGVESMLGDACGPGSPFDSHRQQLSTYTWGHYADLDRDEPQTTGPGASVLDCLKAGLDLLSEPPSGPVLDLGCAVGRTSFALAEATGDPVLGIDISAGMLRLAHRVLRDGTVTYPRRRIGIAYDRRTFAVDLPGAGNVDFWACDALALPFAPHTFGLIAAFNVLDCVASPRELLASASRLLRPGGHLLLATPYDWSTAATPMECWIGGHSQRGPTRGDAEPFLHTLLTPGGHPQSVGGLSLVGERDDVPWDVRLHARSRVSYRSHVLALRK